MMTVRTLLISVVVAVTVLTTRLPAEGVDTVPASAVRSAIDSVRRERDAREAMLQASSATTWPTTRPSPTGRNPRLFWTPQLQAIYYRMSTEAGQGVDSLGARWFSLIKSNAEGNRYGDTGIWATLMYQMTGDPVWVERALTKLSTGLFALTPTTGQLGGNTAREYLMEWVILYDWLAPGLTEDQRAQFGAQLDLVFTAAWAGNQWTPPGQPIRTADSDQTVGIYFATALYYLAAGDHHPPAVTFFNHPQMGGFAATARNRTTLRNALLDYVLSAEGGEWVESGQYNLGTMKLLLMGYLGVLQATGVDYFPEITEWVQSAKFRTTYMLTPDFEDPLQWGDDQDPRAVQLYKVIGLSMLFGDPVTNDLVHSLVARFGATGPGSAEPAITGARGFLAFDPYGPRTSRTALPLTWFARGQGILSSRTSWAPDASLLFAHFPPTLPLGELDHAVHYFGDVQFYRKRAWALTHPIAYAGYPNTGPGVNGMLVGGWGAPAEFRGALTQQDGPGYVYVAGTAGGDVLPAKYYDPPEHWWHEWSRSVLWLQGEPDILVVFDRSHAVDPRSLPKFTRYSAANQALMTNAGAFKQVVFHAPVAPAVSGTVVTWPGVVLTTLDPDRTITVVDERTWPKTEPTRPAERKFQVLFAVQAPQAFDTLLHVVQLGDSAGVSVEPITAGDVRGVLIHRPGQPDTLALFNAAPGPETLPRMAANTWNPANQTMLAGVRQRTTPVSVAWTARRSQTRIFLPEANHAVRVVMHAGAGPQVYP